MSPRQLSHTCKAGFTLVELAIVLLIIGLLAGGTLVGTNLIHAAELKQVLEEKERYISITQQFKMKYNQLPGDFDKAVDFWGMAPSDSSPAADDAACGLLNFASPSVGTNTCNGNNDGYIGYNGDTQRHEPFRFWQHLSNAGFLEQTFTGVAGPDEPFALWHAVIGENVPASDYKNGGWYMSYWTTKNGDSLMFDGFYGHTLTFGAQMDGWGFPTYAPLITPYDAHNMDLKIDDGLPAKGNVSVLYVDTRDLFTFPPSPCHSAANQTDLTATYELEETESVCTLVFRNLKF